MAYWLLKTEPSTYSFADLQKEKRTAWTGVKNAAAQKHMRSMKVGDTLLIYHTGDEKSVVGYGKVLKESYPDPTDKTGKMAAVDIAPGDPVKTPVTLAQIKADPKFKDWGLVRIGRLSVVPTPKEIFDAVARLGK
ncbi:MAG TPA: EVE domain-containing protein [Phycisphaerae bacterium]|jgi:predicted RNA-binding protein with PUA-like domain